MRKIIFLLIISISTQSCGFTPVYNSKNNTFGIKSISYQGDQELNNYINIGLKRYITNNSDNANLVISAITNYSKQIQSKDTKGNTQSFKLGGSVTFSITQNDQIFNFTYTEQSNLDNSDDTFELKSYENSIKQNFASSMVEKLILDLSNRQ